MTAPAAHTRHRPARDSRLDFVWAGFFLCLILWVFASSYAWQSYQKTETQAEETLTNTAQRLSLYLSLSFGEIDRALHESAHSLMARGAEVTQNPAQSLEEITPYFSGFAQIHTLHLIDVSGTPLIGKDMDKGDLFGQVEPLMLGQYLNSHDPRSFFTCSGAKDNLLLTHPMAQIGAYPLGGVSVALRSDYLDQILNAGTKGQPYSYLLSTPKKILHQYPEDIQIPTHRLEPVEELGLTKSLIGHTRYLIAKAPIEGFNLNIIVLQDDETVFQDWKNQTQAYVSIGVLFSGFLLFGAYRLKQNVAQLHLEIQHRHRAQASLKIVSQAVEQSPATVIITDRAANITYVNAKFSETTGYSLDEVIGKNPRFLSVGRNKKTNYNGMWHKLLKGEDWRGEFHNMRKDGTVYWEKALITAIKDDTGEITHFLAIKEDITHNKKADEQLKLTGAVFETASEAIMVCDRYNRIIMVNTSFEEITGYTMAEVIGQTPAMLNSGHHDTSFFAEMFSTLKRTGHWQGEIWNKRKNSQIYPQWLSIKTILDDDGKIERYISLFNDITKRKQDEERILYQANYDALTGLPNRSLFKDRLERALIRADRTQNKIALMFLDLDRFKNVNDTLGHAAGDALLVEAARRLSETVRKTDTVARLGGDEFTIILQDLNDELQTRELIDKLLVNLSAPYEIGQNQAFVSASIGITIFPDDANTLEDLLKNADAAMYRAKENGRNMSQFFTPEMNEKALKRRALEAALYQALEREEFVMHYQPIVEPETGHLHGCEALLRWVHPEHGFVSPATFIPLAEETGLIVPIGEWVINHVFNEARLWEKYSPAPPRVSVNLSSIQFKRSNAADLVKNALAKSGLSAKRATIEITESLLVEDDDLIIDQLDQIREMGVGLSIDDFGTGYSSLSYLKKFPITTLKIDRSFISDMTTEDDSANIVDAILSMAQSLHLKVVAEGVETQDQRNALLDKDCNFIQGYHFSPPLPVAAFRELIKKDQPLQPETAA